MEDVAAVGAPQRAAPLRRAAALVPGISEKMLIQQLREIESDGIVHREVFHEVPPKVEYSVTEFGSTLNDAVTALAKWGKKHEKRIAPASGSESLLHGELSGRASRTSTTSLVSLPVVSTNMPGSRARGFQVFRESVECCRWDCGRSTP